ncbi:MAG: hypothetical protein GXY86_13320 [Firmicutes bacterium]|nr:hypothetical protein [Bacillota bacterium]
MLPEGIVDREKELQLYKSLCNLSDALEFMERDDNGIKMKVTTRYFGGEFPFDLGYVLVSKYDDRKFLVTKIDLSNGCLWLGAWEG